jgi:ribosomal protein L40E
MVHNRCPFCDHANPPDAAFCAHCGAQVDLAPCPKCGAVNKLSASVCYQCHADLSRREAAESSPPAEPAPAPSRSRRTMERVAGVAAVVLIVTIAWVASRGTSLPAAPPAAGVGAAGVTVPAKDGPGAGASAVEAKASLPPVASQGPKAEPGGAGTANQEKSPSASGRAAASVGRVALPPRDVASERDTAPSRDPDPGTTPAAARAARTVAPAAVPCTVAKEALGLCVLKDFERPAPVAAVPSAPKPAAKDSPRPEACTEAVAALGLCAPGTTPGRP